MKSYKKIGIIILSLAIVIIGFIYNNDKYKRFILNQKFIAHALGGIDDKTYTNSLEALEENYNRGMRLFEVDLAMTSDNVMVARHDWGDYLYMQLEQEPKDDKYEPLSESEFRSMRINNKYTPISFEDLLKIMDDKKDMYLVLDTKSTDTEEIIEQYTWIIEKTKKINPKLLNRIIPQIYNRNMLDTININHKFKNVFYTLYLDYISNEEIIEFVKENESIISIIVSELRYDKALIDMLNEQKVSSYVHTINDVDVAKDYFDDGVSGVYTDFLNPLMFSDN